MEEPVDITPYLDQLDESLRDKVLQLQKGRWVPALLSNSGGPALGFYLELSGVAEWWVWRGCGGSVWRGG